MSRELIEELRGVGRVYAAGVLLRTTSYHLSVWHDKSGTDGRATTPRHIDGHIDITGMAEAIVLAGPEELVLEIADGRRLSFAMTGTGGAIVGRGDLQPA
ncbi:MAG: hypothetical protein ACT4QD_09275 [Acidobacteriota bacterium]